ncbi:MAG: hypothetical protein HYS27_22670 [Deltaproteobacteria bacterium]|nr:hypothetical protein [Deltaproteobacteria bacterium]
MARKGSNEGNTLSSALRCTTAALGFLAALSCAPPDDDDDPCDPNVEDVCACDPTASGSCPDDFICRPSGDGAVCVPEASAGRIPACFDPEGLDVLVAEANRALSVSWKMNGDLDHAGGFSVLIKVAANDYVEALEVGPEDRQATLRPLENDIGYLIVIEALDGAGDPSFRSCEVVAVPHVLAFTQDVLIPGDSSGDQRNPDIAASADGELLYLVWEDEGAVMLGISDDFGDSWTARSLASGQQPSVAVREAVLAEDGITLLLPQAAVVAWDRSGEVLVSLFDGDGDALSEEISIGSGAAPDLSISLGVV